MKRCPISYKKLNEFDKYSIEGKKQLSKNLVKLFDFPYSAAEQIRESAVRSLKMSIQGVQPKLSVVLNVKQGLFEVVDKGGQYIIKPQNQMYQNLPENEDLTMKLAKTIGIEVPLTGLIYSKDGSFSYFIKRFDRLLKNKKIHMEDFAQLSEKSRDTKYNSSMEKVAEIIDKFCTFPVIEKKKLFERTIFSFLTGNEDMHLKNFSLIYKDNKVKLSPAYDLINTTIVLKNPIEQLALPINGKKNKLTKIDLINYFGAERLNLNNKVIKTVMNNFVSKLPQMQKSISISFLPKTLKNKYLELLNNRFALLMD